MQHLGEKRKSENNILLITTISNQDLLLLRF